MVWEKGPGLITYPAISLPRNFHKTEIIADVYVDKREPANQAAFIHRITGKLKCQYQCYRSCYLLTCAINMQQSQSRNNEILIRHFPSNF